MQNILIIKTGAAGDVVRTTVLLHVLSGNIFWLTSLQNISLFPDDILNLKLFAAENLPADIYEQEFDLVINLEENIQIAQIVTKLRFKKLIGIYWDKVNEKLAYTPECADWFDMSLISRLGKQRADELKKMNTLSYQQLLLGMLGKTFDGEEYRIYENKSFHVKSTVIGIESRVGDTWPNKAWNGYEQLQQLLIKKGFTIKRFEQKKSLREYFDDIHECSLLISGDTLAMHVALAYKIPCVALFNCTSPHEIYDYGILKKIVSPLLLEAFYKQRNIPQVISSIPVQQVFQAVIETINLRTGQMQK